jgi:hypothetical protein
MSLRDDLNTSLPGRIADAQRSVGFGDALNAALKGLAFTETGVVPAANVGTLANQPSTLFRVLATAETGTVHEKLLLRGPIAGQGAITPPAGACVWDGAKKILFNSVDAVTAFSALYAQAADTTASLLQRTIGEQDRP